MLVRSIFSCNHNVFHHVKEKTEPFGAYLTLSQTNSYFDMSAVQVCRNSVGKGELACNKQFHFFPQSFLSSRRMFHNFHQIQNRCLQTLCRNLNFVVWERAKLLSAKSLDKAKSPEFHLGSTKKRMLLTEAIGIESQSNEFPEFEPFKMVGKNELGIYRIFTTPKWILRMSNLITK